MLLLYKEEALKTRAEKFRAETKNNLSGPLTLLQNYGSIIIPLFVGLFFCAFFGMEKWVPQPREALERAVFLYKNRLRYR